MHNSILQETAERFGFQWKIFSRILPENREQLTQWLGNVPLRSFSGQRVLDVGCGNGRNSYWVAQAGATHLVAIDVDDRTLHTARRNLSSYPTVEVKKCSVFDLEPHQFGLFDRVLCIGVLHHLPEARQAVLNMWTCVKPGGELILWCYANHGNKLILPLIRSLRFASTRLPIGITYFLAQLCALTSWPFVKLFPSRIPYYRNLKRVSYHNFRVIVFDQLLPRIANYWTESQMHSLVADLSPEVSIASVQGNSWSVRIGKPK